MNSVQADNTQHLIHTEYTPHSAVMIVLGLLACSRAGGNGKGDNGGGGGGVNNTERYLLRLGLKNRQMTDRS